MYWYVFILLDQKNCLFAALYWFVLEIGILENFNKKNSFVLFLILLYCSKYFFCKEKKDSFPRYLFQKPLTAKNDDVCDRLSYYYIQQMPSCFHFSVSPFSISCLFKFAYVLVMCRAVSCHDSIFSNQNQQLFFLAFGKNS